MSSPSPLFLSGPLTLWRLADNLTISQAALLLLHCNPDDYENLQRSARAPDGYNALQAAIVDAVRHNKIKADIKPISYETSNSDWETVPGSIDPYQSLIDIASLSAWLNSKRLVPNFFEPEAASSEPYLDPNNERYAPKLAAIVTAWTETGRTPGRGGTAKQQLTKWLRENAARFGLTDEEGRLKEGVIDEVAKVGNWEPQGGAPKTNSEPGLGSGKPIPASSEPARAHIDPPPPGGYKRPKRPSFADDPDWDIPF